MFLLPLIFFAGSGDNLFLLTLMSINKHDLQSQDYKLNLKSVTVNLEIIILNHCSHFPLSSLPPLGKHVELQVKFQSNCSNLAG